MKAFKKLMVSVFVSAMLVGNAGASENRTSGSKHSEVKEINSLARYIKSRNNKIPVELAYMEAVYIVTLSKKHNVESQLISGIIEKESTFNPLARSRRSAKGLMQILICDGVPIDKKQAHDIGYNIDTGIKILKEKIKDANGSVSKGLKLYSGGSRTYANSISSNIDRYQRFLRKKENKAIVAMNK